MGYVVYTRELQVVGYPPAANRNAFAAANMSGVGPSRRQRQANESVFSASGGTRLSGLGAIVPNQTIVNYQGQWQNPITMGAMDVVSQVLSSLSQDGLAVKSSSTDAGILQSLGEPIFGAKPYNVKLQLQVNNGMGYGDPNDIISIIRHEVYQVTGIMPVGDSIPTMQLPASADSPDGGIVVTGQPNQPATAIPTSDFGSWLTNNLALVALGAAAVIVIPSLLKR